MVERHAQELRQRRRILFRSSIGHLAAESRYDESQASTGVNNGPVTRSKTRVKHSASKSVSNSSSGRKEYGPPTTRDSQGRDLFIRPSDGKLVYLHCCVPGCCRANFPNAMALRNHVCSPAGLHKIKGLLTSNIQAIEVCGQVAVSQEEPSTTAGDRPFEAAPVANMTHAVVLSSTPTASDEYRLQRNASSQSISDTEAGSGATLSKAQESGIAYSTRSSHNGSQMEPRTSAEELAEAFNESMSSDSEDSDESEGGALQHLKIPANRIDQHKAANRAMNSSTHLRARAVSSKGRAEIAGDHSAGIILAVDDEAIKKESSANSSLLLQDLEHHASPKTLVAAPEAEYLPNFWTEANHLMPILEAESIATHKRASSAPPVTPPAIAKRLRVTDENSERLVRSCSRSGVIMG